MLGVRSMVQDAPLYFYHPASDYGAIFYADRRIPEVSQHALQQPSDAEHYSSYPGAGQGDAPQTDAALYLLIRETDWPELSESQPHLERLVTSEGKGPDKKHRLVLAAWLPRPEQNGETGSPVLPAPSESEERALPEASDEPVDENSAS